MNRPMLAAAAILVTLATAARSHAQAEKPAATVNGQPITYGEVEVLLKMRPPSPTPLTEAQTHELRLAALDQGCAHLDFVVDSVPLLGDRRQKQRLQGCVVLLHDGPGQPFPDRPDTTPGEFAHAGLPPGQATAAMTVPPGFKVTLFAGEPDVHQPVAFAIDDRGRLCGVATLVTLVQSDPATPIREIYDDDPVRVGADTDVVDVAVLMSDYNLITVPVAVLATLRPLRSTEPGLNLASGPSPVNSPGTPRRKLIDHS